MINRDHLDKTMLEAYGTAAACFVFALLAFTEGVDAFARYVIGGGVASIGLLALVCAIVLHSGNIHERRYQRDLAKKREGAK